MREFEASTEIGTDMAKPNKPEHGSKQLTADDLSAVTRANAALLYQAFAGTPLSEHANSPTLGKPRKRVDLPNKAWQFSQG